MSGRWRNLRIVLLVICGGLLTSAVRAQRTAPVVWPTIEVWGVNGRSFGTIHVAQPTINGIVRYSLLAEFVPLDNKPLTELATKLWPGADPKCLHFNWIQVTVNPGNLPLPVDAAGLPLNPPFLDPPIGGYQNDSKPADALPWFLDETPYIPKKSADLNIHNPRITQSNVLSWYMKPFSPAVPDKMQYDTVLVLINDCARQYEPLGGFHWAANFPASGAPYFAIAPFGPQDWFAHGSLVTAFAGNSKTKRKARPWSIRPLVKP